MTPGVGDRMNVMQCKYCAEYVLYAHREAHSKDCRQRRNAKKAEEMNRQANGLPLYAIAAVRKAPNGEILSEVHYAHAQSARQAEQQFWLGETDRSKVKILKVGHAIGWFQDQVTGLITG